MTAPSTADRTTPAVFAFDGLGCGWEIETTDPLPVSVRDAVLSRVAGFDASWSRFRADSWVSRVARAASGGTFHLPPDAQALFDLYDRLYDATAGAVDPLVGRDLELLGYDARYSLVPAPTGPRHRTEWRHEVQRTGHTMTTRRPVFIDVGAAGKGYLVDRITELLDDNGVEAFVVDGSGDLRRRGSRFLRIGLEDPRDTRRVIGTVELGTGAVCASATNRRRWGPDLHHLLDARTGRPVTGVSATWVIAENAALADGLATALFVAAPEQLAPMADFHWVRMFDDGRVHTSPDFEGQIFR